MQQAKTVSITLDLPSPAGNAGRLFHCRFRAVPQVGDGMEPTARTGDVWMCVPAEGFTYDAVYIVDAFGRAVAYRVTHVGARILELSLDNPRYSPFRVTADQFAEMVLGRACALTRVLDQPAIDAAA
jgi:hypothetical protein